MNVKFRFAGVEVYDLESEKLPNLFHGAPLRYYGRYKKGGGSVTFSGDVLGQSIEQTVKLKLPRENAGNPEIDRMRAYHRVSGTIALGLAAAAAAARQRRKKRNGREAGRGGLENLS